MKFNTNKDQVFVDLSGKHLAVFAGYCVACGRRVYSVRDYHGEELGPKYDTDCRGRLGDRSAAHLVASEYGKQGTDVTICAICENDQGLYEYALKIAFRKWEELK